MRTVKREAGDPELFCEAVPLARLAERHGTPLYVYSAEMIRARMNAFARAFRSVPHTVCYSVKANSTLAILRLVEREGAGFDVVSGGELERVLRVKRAAARSVVFSGVGKTVPEMELALKAGILLFNVESASELRVLAATAARLKKRAADRGAGESGRLGEDSSLHFDRTASAQVRRADSRGARALRRGSATPVSERGGSERPHRLADCRCQFVCRGTGTRRGSGSRTARARTRYSLRRCRRRPGNFLRGSAATTSQTQISAYAKAVLKPLRGLKVHLLLEPGRSIVGAAGVLLTRVIYRKTNNSKRFLIVDAGMNDLLRPSLYGAQHEIVPVVRSSR